ncbi:MAG: hypothetical protein VX656_19830 [Candidatus Latescibacterota bacterium]|nr:hypothetical protein [Candidatus Latescibacterota bacterium]
MTQTARAFAPGNISGVFKIIAHDDPSQMHSLGLGYTVREGVTATVSQRVEDEIRVVFNGDPIDFPTVVSIAQRLVPESGIEIDLQTPLPLSSGFGLSGASALAVAFALNRLLDLGNSRHELAMLAHVVEVEQLTGLGDVCAQYHGGCLVKLRPGDPLAAQPLAVEAGVPLYYRYFSQIRTRDILADPVRRQQINTAADAALTRLGGLASQSSVALADTIDISRSFAEESGLLTHEGVREAIEQVDEQGGQASMIMLGNAVYSTLPFEGSSETALSARPVEAL